ncbi:MAG TPA: MXAN_5187 C-terminal domain-containing protein [Thermoanaerobaculia bacterium]
MSDPPRKPSPPAARPTESVRARFAPPPTPASYLRKLDRLAEGIEQFRVDSERYFNGGLTLPPEELRTKLQVELRELRGVQLRAAAEQYRLGSLEARFNSLSELFGRRLRDREEGRGAVARPVVGRQAPRFDARAGVVLADTGEDEAVEAIWSGLAASGGGGKKLELETFRGYLAQQIDSIRAKTGATSVQFRIVEEDGKVKLKAKPVG